MSLSKELHPSKQLIRLMRERNNAQVIRAEMDAAIVAAELEIKSVLIASDQLHLLSVNFRAVQKIADRANSKPSRNERLESNN